MTLCLDLSAAAHERAGLGRYAASLAQALLPLEPGLTAFVNDLRASRLRPPLSSLPIYTANLPRKRWRLRAAASFFGGPSMDHAFEGVTLFHATEHLLPKLTHARSVFTLHDTAYLLFPQYHLLQNRLYLRLMMPRFLARAEAVIAVSESTRRDAERFYRLDPAKVHVIPEGVEPQFAPIANPQSLIPIRERYRLPARFILYVGTIEPRKNLLTLLEAYAALHVQSPEVGLVIAGGQGWLYESFFERLRQLGLEEHVTLTGYVPDDDLPALLNLAEVFAFPSVFEGFGLPPLEAMACGTPVVTSNVSSLPEVTGDAAVLVDPYEVESIVEGMHRVLTNPVLSAELRVKGMARAREFSWERSVARTREVYQEVGGRH